KKDISKIILGVSSSKRLFQKAKEEKADMIIVHHGLFWKKHGLIKIDGWMKERLSILMKDEINLAAYHLPLDAHPVVGNNAQIIQRLGLIMGEKYDVGFVATTTNGIIFDAFEESVNYKLETKAISFPFGKKEVNKLLLISGSSGDLFEHAAKLGADTFITGNLDESMIRIAEEIELNLINIGHYNSERYGIKALGQIIEKVFDVITAFIDIPNII
ncbi:Nif3-like dinuclear metal center hexameric protein, partial [bacterium]|nr:Nif3-like dinuclear metal center hexameric protein [bacterium]